MQLCHAGIDIGSTTVKLVLLDETGERVFEEYRRHCAHTRETLADLLSDAREQVGDCMLIAGITGSGALGLSRRAFPERMSPSSSAGRMPRSSTSPAPRRNG